MRNSIIVAIAALFAIAMYMGIFQVTGSLDLSLKTLFASPLAFLAGAGGYLTLRNVARQATNADWREWAKLANSL